MSTYFDAGPKFEPRQRRNQEPPEHTAILDRGHLYSAKTQYVSRVLQVLYKIRPPVNGEDHVAFLHEFQTTGIKLQGLTIKNADHLLSSNAYFGRLLRDHHFDLHKLIHLAERCTSHDVFELAQILDLAPSEVVAMFNDMRSADGFFDQRGTWKPALVDFSRVVAPRYGPAAGKDTAEEWLDYAGAQGRAGSRLWGSLETAFPKNKWSQSVGWEVLPGPAFFYDDQFTEYLDAFMSLHDARAQNDWSAYERLLTDYVGVDDNGHLRPRQEQRCLRSVLLGYLETNEIVDGDNCGSCSRCVPNGQFEPSLDKRRQVVISLSSDIKQILDNIKVEPDRLPTPDSSDRLWLLVEREEQAGRAVMGYISGWTNRQLSDTPGHLGALWVRATGMLRQHIPLQTKELLDGVRHLMSKCNGFELQRLVELMVSAHDLMPQAAEPRVLQANLYHRLQQYENELEMWEEVLAVGAENTTIRHEAYMSLVALFAPAGALSDVGEYKKYSVLAARTAQDVDSAIKLYSVILLGWAWPDLEQELVFLHKLSNNSGNLIAQMVRAYYALSLSTPNGRVSSAVEMISLLEQLTQTSDFAQVERIEHYHFDEILQVFKPELSVNRADMAAAVLHYLYEHITKKWQTPRKQLVKVLGYAGRYAEARDLVNECNQPLFVDTGKQKLLAETFLRQCKAPERNPPTNVEDYRLIVESMLGEWRLLRSN